LVFDYFYLFVALTEDPATGEDLAAIAECQVGALLFSVPMQNDAAPTWYRPAQRSGSPVAPLLFL